MPRRNSNINSVRGDARSQLDVILHEIRTRAHDFLGWRWECDVRDVGPNEEGTTYYVRFIKKQRPFEPVTITSPAADYKHAESNQGEQTINDSSQVSE